MARSKLNYWLGEGRDKLIEIALNSRTDKELYEAMGISKDTFYKYSGNSDFLAIIKNAREKHIEDNTERLKKLHEDMWKQAHEQVIEETIQEIETKDGKEYKYMKKTTKRMGGDPTLQIYLDKTYGTNINADEIRSKVEMNKSRAELNRAAANPATAEDSDILKAIMEAGR